MSSFNYFIRVGFKIPLLNIKDVFSHKNSTKECWEIEGECFNSWDDEIMSQLFEDVFGCKVEYYWDSYGRDSYYGFFPHDRGNVVVDLGKFKLSSPHLSFQKLKELEPQFDHIKNKLQALGIEPGEPELFIGEISG